MKERQLNRWVILSVAVILNLFIGIGYAWSVFQKPLMAEFGWTAAEASLTFSILFGLPPITMICCGSFQDKNGPRVVTFVGGIIFGIGMLASGYIKSLMGIYITFGLLLGLGIGLIYGCTTATTVKWFPDKKGLAGGITAAGFGFGAVVFAPIANKLIDAYGVQSTFKILGIMFLVLIPIMALFLVAPKEEKAADGSAKVVVSDIDKKPLEMLSTFKFYILWAVYICGCMAGLMIISFASPIGQEQIGLTPEKAAIIVSVVAVFNTFGRLFWGSVSDKLGRYNTLMVMFVVSAAALFLLKFSTTMVPFVLSAGGIGFAYGGFLGIFPSITAENYGPKNLGVNYGVIFTALGISAIIAPRMASQISAASGSYATAYMIAAGISIAGLILTVVAKKVVAKK